MFKNQNYLNFFIKGSLGINGGNILISSFRFIDNMFFFFSKLVFNLFIVQIKNIIFGVSYGYFVDMFLKGIGYRLWLYNKILFLNIGYTHEIQYKVSKNVLIRTLKNQMLIFGIDVKFVNSVAYNFIKFKIPDVYRGKGVRFVDRSFRTKLGKQR